MKVLILTNLAPISSNLNSGIFIVRRLQKYEKFNVEFDVVSLSFEDNQLVLLIKKLLKKYPVQSKPVEKYENIQFKVASIYRQLNSLLKEKLFNDYYKTTEKYSVEIEKMLKIENYDLIHAHGMYGIPAGLIASILSEKYNKPFIVSLHGSDVNVVMPKRSKIYVKVLESASANIFVSNAILEKAKSYGYSGKNAVVIPNGFDEEIFKPLDKESVRKELEIYKEGYKYIGFVGNLLPIKRADKLGEIFNLIAKEYPKTYFIVVGDGPLREEIKKETEGLNIIFTGRIPQQEVAKWMNAMDVMVLPSRQEGFGAVVIEAQACGTCVIGSSNGGIPEAIGFPEYVVQEGENFEERFAKKVVEVLEHGYDANKLIERSKGFTWRNIVAKEIEVYRNCFIF
ncbi:glycosyltransferase family 4 protein [Fervidobacterium sp. 2310opik-2]|uniref:glycosyltransferase family 4 protein n=1 Tax=Fervidobacterium sp. 2310opik-2 TaxID=1755815 RepID=UPI0013DFD0AC|nr:glycosyltransferase family 4 protein [Fervidobacterium sp. 2310opik-2]KAF2960921.1 glycosyl transferase group 1 [Fervidobacterium sp. 2310opik-2]